MIALHNVDLFLKNSLIDRGLCIDAGHWCGSGNAGFQASRAPLGGREAGGMKWPRNKGHMMLNTAFRAPAWELFQDSPPCVISRDARGTQHSRKSDEKPGSRPLDFAVGLAYPTTRPEGV